MASVAKAEAIETALAHGWVDGQLDRFDDQFWLVRFTHRGPKSKWSQINRDTATRLIAEGRMAPAGLAEVELGQGPTAAGRPPTPTQSKAEVPDDLQAALDAVPEAKAFFATLAKPQSLRCALPDPRRQDRKNPDRADR